MIKKPTKRTIITLKMCSVTETNNVSNGTKEEEGKNPTPNCKLYSSKRVSRLLKSDDGGDIRKREREGGTRLLGKLLKKFHTENRKKGRNKNDVY